MLRIAVVATLIYGVVLAGSPTFTVCSGKDALLQDVQVTTAYPEWKAGTNVTFTIQGRLTSDIVSGTVTTVAYYAGAEAANKVDELCEFDGTPFQCPITSGEHSWEFPFKIPSVPFSGTLTSHSDFKASDGRSMLCLEMSVDL